MIISSTHAKRKGKQTCSMDVDSHFLRSKATKCMEIVSNPSIMDVSHTIDSYGPPCVLLAVIALLLRGALSAAEIGKAHRMQALAAIHNNVCIQKRTDDYQRLISMIYDCHFEWRRNTMKHQTPCIQMEGGQHWAFRSRNDQDWMAQKGGIMGKVGGLCSMCRSTAYKENFLFLFQNSSIHSCLFVLKLDIMLSDSNAHKSAVFHNLFM